MVTPDSDQTGSISQAETRRTSERLRLEAERLQALHEYQALSAYSEDTADPSEMGS